MPGQNFFNDLKRRKAAFNAMLPTLKTIRSKADIGMAAFCRASKHTLDATAMSHWMAKRRTPSWDNIKAIGKSLVDAGRMTPEAYEQACGEPYGKTA